MPLRTRLKPTSALELHDADLAADVPLDTSINQGWGVGLKARVRTT